MDTTEFIIRLIEATVWPAIILVAVLKLRAPIADLILKLKTLKWKDLELTFGKELEEIERKAEETLPAPSPSEPEAPELSPERRFYRQLGLIMPEAAVLSAWNEVEQALASHPARDMEDAIRAHNIRGKDLERAGVLNANEAGIYDSLKRLRNQAAHGRVTGNDAISYVALTRRLLRSIQDSE